MSRFWPFSRAAPASTISKSAQIKEANELLEKCAIMRQVLNSADNQFKGRFDADKQSLNAAWNDLQDIAQSNAFFPSRSKNDIKLKSHSVSLVTIMDKLNTHPEIKKQIDIYEGYIHLKKRKLFAGTYVEWKQFANDYLTPEQIEQYKKVTDVDYRSGVNIPFLKKMTVIKEIKHKKCFDLTPTQLIFLNSKGFNVPIQGQETSLLEFEEDPIKEEPSVAEEEPSVADVGGRRKSRRKRKGSRQVKKFRRRTRKFVSK